MKQKIFRSLVLLTSLSVFLVMLLFAWIAYHYILRDSYDNLKREANVLIASQRDGVISISDLRNLHIDDRVTMIGPDGTALFDNYASYDKMENHFEREEIKEAMTVGEGFSSRASETLGKGILYYAVKLPNGNILRFSRTNDVIFQQANLLFVYLIGIFLLVLIGAFIAAKSITDKVLRPLEQLDLEKATADAVVYPELQPILNYFSLQKERLGREMRRYKSKKQELKAVSNNMNEGMLFLDTHWNVVSINKSAVNFFGKEKQYLLGCNLLSLDGSEEVQRLLNEIATNGKGRLILNRGSSYFQLNGSRIADKGFVLLIMDVTERTASEKLRREFSANVSHELKTPLQSVLGYSEIMLSGLVRPEDTKRFLQKIYDEAQNLLRLIDDIMKLSKLDELSHDMLEEFSLQQIAQKAICRLRDKAKKLEVELILEDTTAKPGVILGISSLMEEIFFNLLDNGLKYNREGGNVTLKISESENKYTVSIKDTGIGIATEELPHIFERFYRVDRSRHKAVEGTGLGLSIVKHGVLFHGGTVRVFSTIGEGTEFVLKFPKKNYIPKDEAVEANAQDSSSNI